MRGGRKCSFGPPKCWKAVVWCLAFVASATENNVSQNNLEILELKVPSLNQNAPPHTVQQVTTPPRGQLKEENEVSSDPIFFGEELFDVLLLFSHSLYLEWEMLSTGDTIIGTSVKESVGNHGLDNNKTDEEGPCTGEFSEPRSKDGHTVCSIIKVHT